MSNLVEYVNYYENNNKIFNSPEYNHVFNMNSGFFARWGKKKEDDPTFSVFGPEVLDIEIASGYCNGGCPWCYKGNTPSLDKRYMSFETYTKLFNKIKTDVLTQIAFGITSIDANPDFFKIMEYTRDNKVIPNYTTNGIGVTETIAKKTKELCGAVAVSVYPHTEQEAYKAIDLYHSYGMDQVNIHFMLCKETMGFARKLLNTMKYDSLKKKVHAIVFLQYKDKNPSAHFSQPSYEEFKELVDFGLDNTINIGFDSCSSAMFMKSVSARPNAKELIQSVDNCESSLFSFYIDVNGVGYPCSFLEGVGDWKEGINVLSCENFIDDVWYSPKLEKYRQTLLNSSKNCVCEHKDTCRSCFVYDINGCKGV